MKTLVTGATGFLGTALCSRLEAEGRQVVRLGSRNCDLTRPDNLRPFEDVEYDRIYHLAAWTQAGDFCLHHPGEQWIINQKINTNVLGWWKERQPQAKMICIGTSCSYDPALDLVEENYLVGKPIDSLFTYAMTKRMLHVGVMALARQFGLRYLCVVPSTLYGPNYRATDKQMHFIFDLIRKIVRGREVGDPVVLWGDGTQRRELVYVDDFVAIMQRLSMFAENDLVNIGAGEDYSIREFAERICERVGYESSNIQYDVSRYVGARSKLLKVRRLNTLIPDIQMTSLDDGLDRTIRWWRAGE